MTLEAEALSEAVGGDGAAASGAERLSHLDDGLGATSLDRLGPLAVELAPEQEVPLAESLFDAVRGDGVEAPCGDVPADAGGSSTSPCGHIADGAT